MNTYDRLLCSYLAYRFRLGVGSRLLDIGCGDGKHVYRFRELGINASGVDKPLIDLERDRIFFHDNFFNSVFCKSVIEHVWNTEHLLSEAKRVLIPGGVAVFLTPDWTANYRMFYDEPTHIKPFTRTGLIRAFEQAGFTKIRCEEFYQLPYLWKHSWLKPLQWLMSLLPDSWKYNKDGEQRVQIRHAKERMLLLEATK